MADTYSLLRNHLLPVLFLPFLNLLIALMFKLAKLGWLRDRRLRLIDLVYFSQRCEVSSYHNISHAGLLLFESIEAHRVAASGSLSRVSLLACA